MSSILHRIGRGSKKVFSIGLKRWYITLVLIGLLGYYFYTQQAKSAKAQEKTYTVKTENLEEILALSGEIDAEEKAELHFQSGGKLSWVGVKEGDRVKQYQGIASLDQRQLEKTLQKYLNTFSKVRADFDQSQDDNQELTLGLTQEIRDRAERTLDQSQVDLNNAVLDVELQTLAKEYAYLYSPIEGIVTRVDAPTAGVNVAITDTFEIINPNTLYFAVSADQTEVVKLHEGMQGTVTFDAFPEREVRGTINAISFTPSTTETGTVYEVKMSFNGDPNAGYRLGMTGDVEFTLKEIKDTIAIPVEYIEQDGDKEFVYKQVNGKKQKVEIESANEYEGMVQITQGVSAGDVIYEVSE